MFQERFHVASMNLLYLILLFPRYAVSMATTLRGYLDYNKVVKLRNLGMCPSRADNVKTLRTKIQPVGNVVVM